MTITPVLFHSSLRLETSWRFCALSTLLTPSCGSRLAGRFFPRVAPVALRRRFRHPSYPRVSDATVQTQEARSDKHLTKPVPPFRLPSHAGPRFARLKPGDPGTGNLGQVRGEEPRCDPPPVPGPWPGICYLFSVANPLILRRRCRRYWYRP